MMIAAPKALIADPDALARNALREALTRQGATVVGQAADEDQLMNLVRRCKPNVVVMDERLPPRGAVAALDALLTALPSVQVVLLAASGEDDAGLIALDKGAAGYLSRDTQLAALARAVVRVRGRGRDLPLDGVPCDRAPSHAPHLDRRATPDQESADHARVGGLGSRRCRSVDGGDRTWSRPVAGRGT